MAAPLIPLLMAGLRVLVSRAAVSAAGRTAAGTAARTTAARVLGGQAAKQGAKSVAGKAAGAAAKKAPNVLQRAAAGATRAAKAPAATPTATASGSFKDVLSGYARQVTGNVKRGWNGEPLQWGEQARRATAPVPAPQSMPQPAATPASGPAAAQPAAQSTPQPSFGDRFRHYARELGSNVRRGWEGQPMQWRPMEPRQPTPTPQYSAPPAPAQIPPQQPAAPQQPAGLSFREIFGSYARQLGQSASSRASDSSLGRLYEAFESVRNYQRASPKDEPKYQPNIKGIGDFPGEFPNIRQDQLDRMGPNPSYGDMVDADVEARVAQKKLEADEKLEAVTKKLGGAFGGLLKLAAWPVAMAAGVYGFSKATVSATSAMIDADVAQYGRYSGTFRMIQAQRQAQDIRLDRRTAVATSGTANFLNQANMQSKDKISELSNDVKNIMNTAAGVLVIAGGIAADILKMYSPIHSMGEWARKNLGGGDFNMNAQFLTMATRRVAEDPANRKPRKPLPPVK